jgi:uncharacterized damage-inducible protein DinB
MTNEEIFIANAVGVWKSVYERANKLFIGLTDEELSREVAPGRNRLIYLLGHLTAVHDRMIVMLGLGERLEPELDAIFVTSADRANELPSAERIRDAWTTVSDRLNAGIKAFSTTQWLEKHTAVTDEDFAKEPLRNRLSILLTRTNHISYHLGQAMLVGRETI